jgi:hypothetical protein
LWTSSFPRDSHRDSTAIFIGGGVPKDFIELSAVAVDILERGDPFEIRSDIRVSRGLRLRRERAGVRRPLKGMLCSVSATQQ